MKLFSRDKSKSKKPELPVKIDLKQYGNKGIRYRIMRGHGDTVGYVKTGTVKFKLDSKKLIFFMPIKGRLYHADIDRVQWYKHKKKLYPEFVFNSSYSEALKQGQDVPDYSQEVELATIGSSVDQFIEVGTIKPAFQIDAKMAMTMFAVAVLLSFLGLDLNSFLHIVPNTVVHWITQPVGNAP